jgi:zinc and cadmium transporter
MVASLSGAVTLGSKSDVWTERNIGILTSFAVGIFGVVIFLLVSELAEHEGLFTTVGWMLLGAGIAAVISKFIPEFHHHHGADERTHTHSRRSAIRILASDGIHNIADGVLITASFLSSGAIGVGIAISVLLHELVQEITEFFVLRQAGYSARQALIRNFVASSTILIGAVGSFYFLETFEYLEGVFLGIAAGGFLVTLVQDLIPYSFKRACNEGRHKLHIVAILLGVVIMTLVGTIGEDHSHGEEELHEEEHQEETHMRN